MNEEITITVNGIKISSRAGVLLSSVIGKEKPCGGHGKCGKCKVIAKGNLSKISENELNMLTKEELGFGVRLACQTIALGDCEVTTLDGNAKPQIIEDGTATDFKVQPSFSRYGIAVDIGTTTVVGRLYDRIGNLLCSRAYLNPQKEWGADVISRIEADLKGLGRNLTEAIQSALNELIVNLCLTAEISPKEIDGAVITGNTVMLSFLVGESTEPFSHAPFDAKRLFGEEINACEIGLGCMADNAKIYLPPCISAFVGADITCGILATNSQNQDGTMLVDVGTNGEMAFNYGGRLTVCSTSAGPAFEGVGISCGMRAEEGAIDKVTLVRGKLIAHVIGEGEAKGICGSGLVDAVACLLDSEQLDESGYLEDESVMLTDKVSVTQKDIRALQLAKSAICAGMITLVKEREKGEEIVKTLYIAGGFGNYLNKNSASRIKLLPKNLACVSICVGNCALSGASMILLNPDFRSESEKIAKKAQTLSLATDKIFVENYIKFMSF